MKLKTLSVFEVNNYIKKMLDNDFILNNLSVKGEISNLKYHSSGHIYFSLKDEESKINCIMFKNSAINLSFKLEEGMEVIVEGRASVYAANGSFQIYCNSIKKQGIGELFLKFEELKKKLEGKGYFENQYKKPLPAYIEKIGVVTSETGAAIQDITNVIRRRNKFVDIILYPAKVQGIGAYKSIIKGIEYFNKSKMVDVIIVGRGGGSIEELWNFNEEALALSIFNSKLPIVSAVGHEVDFTISDFVADLRAATPSQAGELVATIDTDIINNVKTAEDQLLRLIEEKIYDEKRKLDTLSKILELNSPLNRIANSYIKIDNLKDKLNSILENKIEKEKMNLIAKNNILLANNPINILTKGYAIIRDNENNCINSINEIDNGENINIILKDGYVKGNLSIVEKGGDVFGQGKL